MPTSASLINCSSPNVSSAGPLLFRVSLNGQQFTLTNHSYGYYGAAQLGPTSLSPSSGPNDGRTLVTVTAEHLSAGSEYNCSFGTAGRVTRPLRASLSSTQTARGWTYGKPLKLQNDYVVCEGEHGARLKQAWAWGRRWLGGDSASGYAAVAKTPTLSEGVHELKRDSAVAQHHRASSASEPRSQHLGALGVAQPNHGRMARRRLRDSRRRA